MIENPFSRDSQIRQLFDILSDLEWHCASCELPGSQPAATIRDLRRMGYDVKSAARKGGDEAARYCERCRQIRTHYRLTDHRPVHSPKERSSLPGWLVERILDVCEYREAVTGRTRHPKDLTVDHKIPNIRWLESEERYEPSITDSDIIEKFQLLTNEDNLWKSRMCETCKETGKRQPFLGILFFYIGIEDYDDERGCRGCGWHDPVAWKSELNKLLREYCGGTAR